MPVTHQPLTRSSLVIRGIFHKPAYLSEACATPTVSACVQLQG
jgi:hypothetical protein